jgi:hypothetical protein
VTKKSETTLRLYSITYIRVFAAAKSTKKAAHAAPYSSFIALGSKTTRLPRRCPAKEEKNYYKHVGNLEVNENFEKEGIL